MQEASGCGGLVGVKPSVRGSERLVGVKNREFSGCAVWEVSGFGRLVFQGGCPQILLNVICCQISDFF